MARTFEAKRFDQEYETHVVAGRFQEEPAYYPRYKSRYRENLRLYAALAPQAPAAVLDLGGGQHALLARRIWGDDAAVGDLPGPHFDYLLEHGVRAEGWNLVEGEPPFGPEFDAVFFSEVIEHLPVPGHLPLAKIRRVLKPGGLLLLTTPNLFRARNVVYMLLGRRMFDNFRYPEGVGCGHILEYCRDHLRWQLEKAGFAVERIDRRHFPHAPTSPAFRALAWVGRPLYWLPRLRDNLVAVARNPG